MAISINSLSQYLTAFSLGGVFTKEQLMLWLLDYIPERHPRTERVLALLEDEGKIRSAWFHGRKVYWQTGRYKGTHPNYEHELRTTGALLRFYVCRRDSIIVPNHLFRGLPMVPDCALHLPEEVLLCVEYGSTDNFYLTKSKLENYQDGVQVLEDTFGTQVLVVFILDVERERLAKYLKTFGVPGPRYYFTDYESFVNTTFGEAFSAPIWYWRGSEDDPWGCYSLTE